MNTPPARRTFLNKIWGFFALLTCIELSWIFGSLFTTTRNKGADDTRNTMISAGNVDSFLIDSVTPVSEGQFYLVRQDDGSFLALSKKCTHLGCSLNWNEEAKQFTCPCHGSRFSMAGDVLTPPATRGLADYPIRIENGEVRVNITRQRKYQGKQVSRSVQA